MRVDTCEQLLAPQTWAVCLKFFELPGKRGRETRCCLFFLLQVLEFHPDATVLETCKTPEVLALHPRVGMSHLMLYGLVQLSMPSALV